MSPPRQYAREDDGNARRPRLGHHSAKNFLPETLPLCQCRVEAGEEFPTVPEIRKHISVSGNRESFLGLDLDALVPAYETCGF